VPEIETRPTDDAIIIQLQAWEVELDLSSILISVVAPLCIIYVVFKIKDGNKVALKQVADTLELQRENNNILREILAALTGKE